MDEHAEDAELELDRIIERLQAKWSICDRTMAFLLAQAARDYEAKAVARGWLDAKG